MLSDFLLADKMYHLHNKKAQGISTPNMIVAAVIVGLVIAAVYFFIIRAELTKRLSELPLEEEVEEEVEVVPECNVKGYVRMAEDIGRPEIHYIEGNPTNLYLFGNNIYNAHKRINLFRFESEEKTFGIRVSFDIGQFYNRVLDFDCCAFEDVCKNRVGWGQEIENPSVLYQFHHTQYYPYSKEKGFPLCEYQPKPAYKPGMIPLFCTSNNLFYKTQKLFFVSIEKLIRDDNNKILVKQKNDCSVVLNFFDSPLYSPPIFLVRWSIIENKPIIVVWPDDKKIIFATDSDLRKFERYNFEKAVVLNKTELNLDSLNRKFKVKGREEFIKLILSLINSKNIDEFSANLKNIYNSKYNISVNCRASLFGEKCWKNAFDTIDNIKRNKEKCTSEYLCSFDESGTNFEDCNFVYNSLYKDYMFCSTNDKNKCLIYYFRDTFYPNRGFIPDPQVLTDFEWVIKKRGLKSLFYDPESIYKPVYILKV